MHSAILGTLAYADIFAYPLTAREIHRWLISPQPASLKTITFHLGQLVSHRQVKKTGNYYTLKRPELVALRKKRAHWSHIKWKEAKRVGEWLKIVPTISAVSVTGALAMENADKFDDIDLLIVTIPHTLWLTRLAVVGLTELLRVRRRPLRINPRSYPRQSASTNNKICLNLWLDETSLTLAKSQRNLYTAHEVAQAKTLWSRGEVDKKFLAANNWINHYLVNIKIPTKPKRVLLTSHFSLLTSINRLAFNLQLWYMKSKRTREKVTLHSAFFHPKNMRKYVAREYQKRLQQSGISQTLAL